MAICQNLSEILKLFITLIEWIGKCKTRSNTMFVAKLYLKPAYSEF